MPRDSNFRAAVRASGLTKRFGDGESAILALRGIGAIRSSRWTRARSRRKWPHAPPPWKSRAPGFWPPMLLDRPLGVGASGGHGPVRYVVEAFRPGQRVQFRFAGPRGFNGCHRFEILPTGEHSTILRHTLDMNAEGPALLSWPLVFRPLHDALLEDALARAQASLGKNPLVRPWSPWVKFLRWLPSGGKAKAATQRHSMSPVTKERS